MNQNRASFTPKEASRGEDSFQTFAEDELSSLSFLHFLFTHTFYTHHLFLPVVQKKATKGIIQVRIMAFVACRLMGVQTIAVTSCYG